jgi:2,5-dichlorohydroquinone reductive dechlorinase
MSDTGLVNIQEALATRFPGVPVPIGVGKRPPHLHLYHAPNSICAQKVRTTFAATGQSYVSHSLNLFGGDSYDPAYVRVRLAGCLSAGLELVRDHSGTTSVTRTGCDPCVVPTVVDETTHEVIVDSRRICLELDRRNPAGPGVLSPEDLRSEIEAELTLVDDLPNYQLLASTFGKPSQDAPDNAFASAKVARCDRLLKEHGNDHSLRMAYLSKRAKEAMAADRLFSKDAIASAQAQIAAALGALDRRLQVSSGPHLFGRRLTIADLFWGVELIRLDDLGLASIWKDPALTKLSSYYQSLCQLPAIRDAVLEWPGARFRR